MYSTTTQNNPSVDATNTQTQQQSVSQPQQLQQLQHPEQQQQGGGFINSTNPYGEMVLPTYLGMQSGTQEIPPQQGILPQGIYAGGILSQGIASQGISPQGIPGEISDATSGFNYEAFQTIMAEKMENEQNRDDAFGLYEFPFEHFPLKKFVLLLGPRDTGKSTLLYYTLYRMRTKIETSIFCCSSEDSDSVVEGVIPGCFCYSQLLPSMFANIRKRDKSIKQTFKVTGKMPPGSPTGEVLVIGDDILHDKKALKNQEFARAILSGRHEGQGLWILLQYAANFPKELRKQIDYIFLQAHPTRAELEYIHKEFTSGVVPDYDLFERMMRHYTQNYGTLVFKTKGSDPSDISSCVWYIRALTKQQLPAFRLDAGGMWKFSEKHERKLEEKSVILDYQSSDIFNMSKALQNQGGKSKFPTKSTSTRKSGGGRGGSVPIFRLPG